GNEPSKLSDALKRALENRVDAAVAAGRLTKAKGDTLKARIESGELPLFLTGRPHDFGLVHHGPGLDAAATDLGLTEAQLRTELTSGKTLAQIATAHGKTIDGLIGALVDQAKHKLDRAVAGGRLTKAEANRILPSLKERITNFAKSRFGLPFHGER